MYKDIVVSDNFSKRANFQNNCTLLWGLVGATAIFARIVKNCNIIVYC